jgi:L-carnitine CoA-transferase
MKKSEIPAFGALRNLKVAISGTAIAAPVAGCLMAEWGADVIQIESAKMPDMYRAWPYGWVQDRRNLRMISTDMWSEGGSAILQKMLSESDILIESSKGGTWASHGFTDEKMWEINPKLVIVHISGFGQYGDPNYIKLPSYDVTTQNFAGMSLVNGEKDGEPYMVQPFVGDYYCALTACASALAAYIRAQETGKGDSLDMATYEVGMRYMADYAGKGFNDGEKSEDIRLNTSGKSSPYFKTKDGKWCCIYVLPNHVAPTLEWLGVDLNDPRLAGDYPVYWPSDSEEYREIFHPAAEAFCAKHTAEEINREVNKVAIGGVPNEFVDMLDHPQFKARNDIIEYYDDTFGKNVKAVAPTPKFSNNPQQIWRGGPITGMDNDDILEELGYSSDEIKDLYSKNVIVKD